MSSVINLEEAKQESPFPELDDRPRYVVLDGWQEHEGRKQKPGVYYCGYKEKKDELPTLINQWICSPLHIDAITRDDQGNNFGRLIRFKPTVGAWRKFPMPMELLKGSGEELRGLLLSMGVEIDPYGRNQLGAYVQSQHPSEHVKCATQTGWLDGAFVLPGETIGATDIVFQSGEPVSDEFKTHGSYDEWRNVPKLAIGNDNLVLALSAAFAGPILRPLNMDGGGVHFVGDSSTGKSTLLNAACSVWGSENYRRSWRTTSNGLEGVAAMFNDGLLALDEISEAEPRDIGPIVYSLGNGKGKQRASRSGAARSIKSWRNLILSSGERTIESSMREGGYRAKAGQAVRMLDIPVTRAHGAWDELHGYDNGAAFSDAVNTITKQHYGHAGRDYLTHLVADDINLSEHYELIKAQLPTGKSGQIERGAARFALIALAGELATRYGITGWPESTAFNAALNCFNLWRSTRSEGSDEHHRILEAVSDYIDKYGDSRFTDVLDTKNSPYPRSGYIDRKTGEAIYLFNGDGLKEATKGFDFKRALDALEEAGAIPKPGADGKRAQAKRIGGTTKKVYSINPEKLVTEK